MRDYNADNGVRPKKKQKMEASLLSLPNEILDKIFAQLEFESYVALARSNKRLYRIAMRRIKSIKLEKVSRLGLRFMAENGVLVQKLDLSNVVSESNNIQSVLSSCPLLTDLNLINSTLNYQDLLEVLPYLSKLKSLSLTLQFKGPAMFPHFSISRSVKTLYVETNPECVLLAGVIGMIEKMEALESAHVHVVGKTYDPEFHQVPLMSANRWETLRTFVVTQHWSDARNSLFHYFLHRVFLFNRTPGTQRWLDRDRDCYIYEHGFFNHDPDHKTVQDERIQLLKEFQVVDLVRDSNAYGTLVSRWGEPRSLRVKDENRTSSLPSVNIFGLCTSALMELDLSECHGDFSVDFWIKLAEASPSLESLSTPLCLFLVFLDGKESGDASQELQKLSATLQKMPLKKLYVRGYKNYDPKFRQIFYRRCEAPLSLNNLPQLRNLRRLESLTFTDIYFEPSAVAHMAHPTIHTLRLNLRAIDKLNGVRELIQGCANVRNFQLLGFSMPLRCSELWDVLALGKNFKRLCLGTRTWFPIDPADNNCAKTKADFIHCHMPRVAAVDGSFPIGLEYARACNSGLVPVHPRNPLASSERGLCCSESFIGVPQPRLWETT